MRCAVGVSPTCGKWRWLAMLGLWAWSALCWAGAAGLDYQIFWSPGEPGSAGCAASLTAGSAAGSPGRFAYRLTLTMDAHGTPLPLRWSVCQHGEFVEQQVGAPMQWWLDASEPGAQGLEDVFVLSLPWSWLGDAAAVRAVVLSGADVMDRAPAGGGLIWLSRPGSTGEVPAVGLRAVPALHPVAGVLLAGLLLGLACWRGGAAGQRPGRVVGPMLLLLCLVPMWAPGAAQAPDEGWVLVGQDAAGDVPPGQSDLLSLQAQSHDGLLYLRLRTRGNNHAPRLEPAPAQPQRLERGQEGLLRLQAHDADGDPLRWRWQGEVPPGLMLQPGPEAGEVTLQARFEQAGLVQATLQVLDPAGAWDQVALAWQVDAGQADPDAGACTVLGGGGLATGGIDRRRLPSYASASDYATLRRLLDQGVRHVFIPSGVTIEVPNRKYALVLQPGQTLFGDRGQDGQAGGRLRVAYEDETPHEWAVISLSAGSRLSGLRVEGPFQAAGTANNTIGLQMAVEAEGIEVDHNELYGWPWAAVSVKRARGAQVHHNYIHHNIKSGLGYGVVVQNGDTSVDIGCNVFHVNRHAIAGSGQSGERYEAHHNLVRPGGGRDAYHQVDMHAYPHTRQAGAFLSIHDNWFDYGQYGTMSRVVIGIRGIPSDGPPLIEGNFFNQPYHVSSTQDSISLTVNTRPSEAELRRDNRFQVRFEYRREGDRCVLGWLGRRQTVDCTSVGLGP